MSLRTLFAISIPWAGLSMLADGLSALLLPYLLLVTVADHLQATVLGLTTLVGYGMGILVQPLAGAASDRVGTRRPLLIGGTVAALTGIAVLGIGERGSSAAVLIGYLTALVGANVSQAGLQALIPDRVPATWRGRAAGLKGFMDVGGAFAAFAILAALLASAQVLLALIILGAGVALTASTPLLARGEVVGPHRRGVGLGPTTLWRGLGHQPTFGRLLIARFCFLLGIYAVGRFLVLFMISRLGFDPDAAAAEAGVVLAVLALVTAVASLPAGWAADRFGRRPLMVGGALSAAVGIGLLPFAATTVQITLLGMLLALGTTGFGAGSWALTTDLVSADETARHMGLANYATAGAAAAAGLFGPLVDAGERVAAGMGFALLMVLAATAAVLSGFVALRLPESVAIPIASRPTHQWKD